MPSTLNLLPFQICLLGNFEIKKISALSETSTVALAYDKGRALLTYLACHPGVEQNRGKLAELLWPDFSRDAALTNLRMVLHDLRAKLNPDPHAAPCLFIDRSSIQFNPVYANRVDVHLFSTAFPLNPHNAETNLTTDHVQLEKLVAAYRGNFMESFSVQGCDAFEEWLQVKRETFLRRTLSALERLANKYQAIAQFDKALEYAHRFCELEPWNEDGHRRVMRLYSANGQPSTALSHFDSCVRMLKSELGVTPSPQTQLLAEQIRLGLSSEVAQETKAFRTFERKQVTTVYCEILATDHEEPEDRLASLLEPRRICLAIFQRYSGYVIQKHGSGLLAYFGFPLAHEQAAKLAVGAALEIAQLELPDCQFKLGIHTGMIIVGDDESIPDSIGATSELAIRLRLIAEPGEIIISQASHQLIQGYFSCQDLGDQLLRGIGKPVKVYRVKKKSGALDRIQAVTELTPYVGRKSELQQLHAQWEHIVKGHKSTVLLSGDAGIGKSRLLHVFFEQINSEHVKTIELRGQQEHQQSPFQPFSNLFDTTFNLDICQNPGERFAQLVRYITFVGSENAAESISVLAKILQIPVQEPYAEFASSPQKLRQLATAWILSRLHTLAKQGPVIIHAEDLHWIDPSTLEILSHLIGSEENLPIFILLTARKNYLPNWQATTSDAPETRRLQITLQPLSSDELQTLITSINSDLSPSTISQIIQRADGIPLFAEEMSKYVAPQKNIPSTLHDLLFARLDDLGEAKFVAQMAATLGREFHFSLLQATSPFKQHQLKNALTTLCDQGLLYVLNEHEYQFKHALIQEAAYQSQSRTSLKAMHLRIALAIENHFPEWLVTQPAVLAQHFQNAESWETAIRYWLKAGERSASMSAMQEAINHFQMGLSCIEKLEKDATRKELHLNLLVSLSTCQRVCYGYGSPIASATYELALTLCDPDENNPAVFRALWGVWGTASTSSGYSFALDLSYRLLKLAEQSNDDIYLQQAWYTICNILLWQGNFVDSRPFAEKVLQSFKAEHHREHFIQFGESACISAGSHLSWVLWFSGYPDQARKMSYDMLKLAEEINHPYSLAYALTFASVLARWMGDKKDALKFSEAGRALALKHDFQIWLAGCCLTHGWAEIMHGHEYGETEIKGSVEAMRNAMGGVAIGFLTPLADALVNLGKFSDAEQVITEALSVSEQIGDAHALADLHRLKGLCLQNTQPDNMQAAVSSFENAITISRQQMAKSLELRATMDLCVLLVSQGGENQAMKMLLNIYNWFNEGFDTPDLLRAKAILLDLSKINTFH